MNTTHRQQCGTVQGLIAHSAAEEPACGECRHAELVRRVSVEAWPIGLWNVAELRITKQHAAENLAVLMEAMADVDDPDEVDPVDHPQPVRPPVDRAASPVHLDDPKETP